VSKKTLLKSWDQDKMILAVAAVRKKQMGVKKVQKLFNVAKASLRPYVNMKDKTPAEAVLTKLGRSLFSPEILSKGQ
jgi:hypothetical protein